MPESSMRTLERASASNYANPITDSRLLSRLPLVRGVTGITGMLILSSTPLEDTRDSHTAPNRRSGLP